MTQMLPAVELQVLQGHSCFDVLKKGVIAPVGTITARLRQNLIQNIYATVSGTLASAKAKGKSYKRPSLPHRRLILSYIVAKIVTDTGLKDFDLLVELRCTGFGKIAIPLKRNRVLNKYLAMPGAKLCSSIMLTDSYIQFSVEFEVPKKPMQKAIGLDPGAVNLLTDDSGNHYGTNIGLLLHKLHRKRRYSNAWYRCKRELSSFIGYTVKQLPWNSFDTVVLENNRNIKYKSSNRGRLSRKIRSFLDGWAVGELDKRIEYASQLNGVSLRRMASFNNSRTCPVCGCVKKENRVSQSKFICTECGHSAHADVVGAINVLARFSLGKYGSECKAYFRELHPDCYDLDKVL